MTFALVLLLEAFTDWEAGDTYYGAFFLDLFILLFLGVIFGVI